MFTMVEFNKTERPPLQKGVVKKFVETSTLLRTVPWENITGPASAWMQQASLPDVTKRAVGEQYGHAQGTYDPNFEALKIQGGISVFDNFQVATGGRGRRAQETESYVEAIALNFDRDFIKGDASSDVRDFDGLQRRLTGDQLIQADPTGGTVKPLSIVQALACKKRVANPTHWIMSEAMQNWISVMAHDTTKGGYITRDKDSIGEEVIRFCGLPILVVRTDSQDADILDWNELVTAGGSNGTSIYCVSLRPDRLHGIQNAPPNAKDLGLDPTNGVLWNTVIEWYASIKLEHKRSACRYRDIANAMPTLTVS